jgi:hypothetical protein
MSHYPPQYPPPYPPQYPAPPYGQAYGEIPYAQAYLFRRPGVVTWFYVYCVCMALLYGGLLVLFGWLASQGELDPSDEFTMGFAVVVCVPLMLVFGVAILLPRRPWVWIYDLVLICLGISGITAVASIPLLIFWLKPEAKAWFGRQA